MPLSVGDRLGPYEIVSPIGAGGMGEVYKARDGRLDRMVALKVSKAEFTERFAREARTVAQLNHPNVCTLFDVGPNYLVMEFVEGTPLLSEANPEPLPTEKALEYSGQILDALDAAHRKGIVHRDLKPANVMITKQGIKLLDFGLAKQTGALSAGPEDVTMTALSMEGQISGTLQYMAPEQLEGKSADARSDIFAFGLVLYEMISGQRPFTGATPANTIASIMREQPRPLNELQPLAPPGLDPIVQTCLEKDPDKRWQSAREVKHALMWMARNSVPSAVTQATTAATFPAKNFRLWQSAAVVLGLAAVALAGWMLRPKPEPPAPITRFEVSLPDNVNFGQYVSLSPDGRKLVINTTGNNGIWIRDMDALEWRRLPGTEGAASPFWSPDGRFLAFAVQNQLKKIDISGGPAQTLCTLSEGTVGSGAWNRDGVIIFANRPSGGILRVSQAGGIPTPVTAVDYSRGEVFHTLPIFMPDGKHFIYFRQGGPAVAGVYAGLLEAKPTEQPRDRILANTFAALEADRRLFFMQENNLMVQPFDVDRMQLRGEPVPLIERVGTTGAIGVFSVSPGGVLAWRPGVGGRQFLLTWFDREGKVLNTFGQPGDDQTVALSPDGTRAIVRDGSVVTLGDLWQIDFARGVRTRVTFRKTFGSGAIWSPDGTRIVFSAGNPRAPLDTLYEKSSSGAGEEKVLLKMQGQNLYATNWSRDGRFLLFYFSPNPKAGADLWVLPLEGDRKPVPLLATEFNELEAVFSPDARWVAYASNESGRFEVYVRPFLASGPSGAPSLGEGKWQISRDGGATPKWTADGKQIIFSSTFNDNLATLRMAVDVKANGAAFEAGVPQRLLQVTQVPSDFSWDVSGDGKRFLLTAPQGLSNGPVPLDVMLNWQTAVRSK